jgi:GT2 family glycosyltransferase
MKIYPRVVLVIINYNSLKKVGQKALHFIRSIISTDYPNFDIVVVDNGSDDGSDELIEEELRGRGRVVRAGSNLGHAGGCNLGFKMGYQGSKYVAFLDNDIVVEPRWLVKIIDILESDNNIAAAQPAILQLSRNLVDCYGGMIDRLGWIYELWSNCPEPVDIKQPFEVFWAKSATIVVRSDVFKIIGGFDEDFFVYYDEVDLCWRIRLLGYKVVTVPTARIYHMGRGTMGGTNFLSIYMHRKNHLTMLIRNYQLKNALTYSVILIIIYLLAIVKELVRKRKAVSYAVLMALMWNIRNFGKTIHKRVFIQSIRKVSDKVINKHMLRIFEYKRNISCRG